MHGEGGVEDASVGEIRLVGVLHLHDKVLALLGGAIHVKNGIAFACDTAQLLGGHIRDVLDRLLVLQERVEEIDHKLFVMLVAEKAFETKVGKWVDISLGAHDGGVVLVSSPQI